MTALEYCVHSRFWVASSCAHDVTADIQRPICLHHMVPARYTPEPRHWAVARVDARMACMGWVTVRKRCGYEQLQSLQTRHCPVWWGQPTVPRPSLVW